MSGIELLNLVAAYMPGLFLLDFVVFQLALRFAAVRHTRRIRERHLAS